MLAGMTLPPGGTLFLPGFGGDTTPPAFLSHFPAPVEVVDYAGCASPENFASRIAGALDRARPRVVVGHSVGGYLAVRALASRPYPSVQRLVLFGVAPRLDPGRVLAMVVRLPLPLMVVFLGMHLLAAPYFFLREGRAARQRYGLFRNLRHLGLRMAARSCRETFFRLAIDHPPLGPVEVEIVALKRDILVTERDIERLRELLPGSHVTWVEAPGIHLTSDLINRFYRPPEALREPA